MSDRQGATDRDRTSARAQLHEFVRNHHPDVGGDPEYFMAGLAKLRAQRDRAAEDTAAVRTRDRGDAPIVLVRRHGLRGLWERLRAWRARRRRGPRVR